MHSLLNYPATDWVKLFKLYFDIEVSDNFFKCADAQLSSLFETLTNLKIAKYKNRIYCVPSLIIDFKQGENSRFTGEIMFKTGQIPVQIKWTSRSKKQIKLSDNNIDCNDLQFEFEELDIALCKKIANPIWSLFTNIYRKRTIEDFQRTCGISVSNAFLDCADKQLTRIFETETGLKVNQHIWLLSRKFPPDWQISEEKSALPLTLYLKGDWHFLEMEWQSRTGKIVQPDSEDISCDDLIFSFHDLDLKCIAEKNKSVKKAFAHLKSLHYILEVETLVTDMKLDIILTEKSDKDSSILEKGITDFINNFNDMDENKVHRFDFDIEHGKLVVHLDTGTAGTDFLEKFFLFLNQFTFIKKVVVH